ncbi:hypothetical protein FJZ53_06070 [Candidatus Woesearchaeota archaeon]|nr:hypothetical protein [Candidatus Woesearchaeota archaeon]
MSSNIIIPPNYVKKISSPLIFLAGPIQGVYTWQDEAIRIINELAPEVYIANPRRAVNIEHDFSPEMYNEQVDWETYHLKKAGKKGVIMFWLAKETKHLCERAYAQTSRFELGEWKAKHEKNKAQVVVGLEEGFTGTKYILRRLSKDCPNIPICRTLEETCKEAIRLARLKA